MILISIHPFAFRKLFLLVVAFLCLSSAACFADSLFMARQYAPDQPRSTPVSSRRVEVSNRVRIVSVGGSAWADVSEPIGTALAEASAEDSSNCRTNDYVMAWGAVVTEDTFARTLAERRIFLF